MSTMTSENVSLALKQNTIWSKTIIVRVLPICLDQTSTCSMNIVHSDRRTWEIEALQKTLLLSPFRYLLQKTWPTFAWSLYSANDLAILTWLLEEVTEGRYDDSFTKWNAFKQEDVFFICFKSDSSQVLQIQTNDHWGRAPRNSMSLQRPGSKWKE